MRTVYRVKYQERYSSEGEEDWQTETMTVMTERDAQAAVDEVREHSLAQSWEVKDDSGAPREERVVAFRLISVEPVVTVDLLA